MKDNILLTLLVVIAPLSLMAVGGGQAILPEVHRQLVLSHGFVTETQFVTDFTISKMAPGPTSLMISLMGWQAAGWQGMVVATIAIFAPSSILVLLMARVWSRHSGAAWQKAVERGLAPIAAGLILASTLTIARALGGGWLAALVSLVVTVLMLITRVNPLWAIGGGAAVFLLAGMV